jgi:hypothetical protein
MRLLLGLMAAIVNILQSDRGTLAPTPLGQVKAPIQLDVLLSNRKMKKMHVLISHYFLPIFVEN